jgi:hypothetical protein
MNEENNLREAELVTIQLTLSKDDVSFLQEIVESGEDMGIGICKHIVEQYNAVKARGLIK